MTGKEGNAAATELKSGKAGSVNAFSADAWELVFPLKILNHPPGIAYRIARGSFPVGDFPWAGKKTRSGGTNFIRQPRMRTHPTKVRHCVSSRVSFQQRGNPLQKCPNRSPGGDPRPPHVANLHCCGCIA